MTLSDLLADILGRIEENVENGPVFWSLVDEVYPVMADAMFEASLVTGFTQSINQIVTLTANTTYFYCPIGTIAPLRMRAAYPIRKNSLRGLDDMNPRWQTIPSDTQIRGWFPLGVTRFGIYPQLTADSQVVMDFITSPVNQRRPYSGTVGIPFQAEFTDAFAQYGTAMLRAKEGTAEAEEASTVYQEYMERMKALSAFQGRLDALVMTSTWGGKAMTNPRKVV